MRLAVIFFTPLGGGSGPQRLKYSLFPLFLKSRWQLEILSRMGTFTYRLGFRPKVRPAGKHVHRYSRRKIHDDDRNCIHL